MIKIENPFPTSQATTSITVESKSQSSSSLGYGVPVFDELVTKANNGDQSSIDQLIELSNI